MKLKALTILGLVVFIALVATTFVVYSFAAPTQIHAVNGMHGEDHGSMMHGSTMGSSMMGDSIMHNDLMDDMHNSTMHDSTMSNSTMHNETEESRYGCH